VDSLRREALGRWALVGAGGLALVAAAVLVRGVWVSVPGFAGFTPARHFISQLGDPYSPTAAAFDRALLTGGSLLALAMAVAAAVVGRGSLRRTGAYAAGAGLSVAMVGVYSLTRPVPHLVFALAAGTFGVAATVSLARTLRRARDAGATARAVVAAAHAARTLVWIQLGCVAGALASVVRLALRIRPTSLEDLLYVRPEVLLIELGAAWVNPLAVLEWIFFSAQLLALVGAAAALATGVLRARPWLAP
jgi:hypothetical membrane protein